MSTLVNLVLDSILKAKSASTTSTTATATDANAPNFASVLSALNIKVNSATIQTQNSDIKAFLNPNDTSLSLNIDAIVQQVMNAKKNGSTLSTDGLIKKYLLKNFGGSEEEVIKKLAGVQNLPSGSTILQSLAFNNIVSKISTQVRAKITNEEKINNDSGEETVSDADLSSTLDSGSSVNSSSDSPFM